MTYEQLYNMVKMERRRGVPRYHLATPGDVELARAAGDPYGCILATGHWWGIGDYAYRFDFGRFYVPDCEICFPPASADDPAIQGVAADRIIFDDLGPGIDGDTPLNHAQEEWLGIVTPERLAALTGDTEIQRLRNTIRNAAAQRMAENLDRALVQNYGGAQWEPEQLDRFREQWEQANPPPF